MSSVILFDTNVISEAMKLDADPIVHDWLDERTAETLYLSSITVAELMFGIGMLSRGRRRDR